jgi:hypothetical protein
MHTINIPTMALLIKHVGVNLRHALMFWGKPGVGKSEGIRAAAEDLGGHLIDIRLSQYDSVDLRGIPSPDSASGLTVWYAPATLPFKGNARFAHLKDALIFLFLDEVNSATPAVSAVAYQLINEYRVGEHELMDNVVVLAAGNREGDRGVTNRMPTPLSNRFTHAEIVEDVDAYCEWHQNQGLPPVGVAFLQFRKPLLCTFDPSRTDKAFATPRSWSKAFAYHASDMPESLKRVAMAGAVGEGPATEFMAFLDVWHKMIPISQIIANPKGAALPEELAMAYAMSVAISGSMTPETITPLCIYLDRLAQQPQTGPEFVVLAWTMATKRDKTLYTTKEFLDFSKKYRVVFS